MTDVETGSNHDRQVSIHPAVAGAVERLELPDGEGVLYRRAFASVESADLFAALQRETPWRQHVITLYGRSIASPRLSAWYGDPGAVYSYSGLRLEPEPWTPTLRIVRERVEALAMARFNSVLLNLYRDGQDSMGWHSDDEPELGRNPVIASVSLGAARRFLLQHKKQRLRVELLLEDGDVLVLGGATQHHWRHHVPKTRQPVGSRINLTFRTILGRQHPASGRSGRGSDLQ
jgi:alkylated DNA repair dioxygenase AlkB